jgi:hypothetical protein
MPSNRRLQIIVQDVGPTAVEELVRMTGSYAVDLSSGDDRSSALDMARNRLVERAQPTFLILGPTSRHGDSSDARALREEFQSLGVVAPWYVWQAIQAVEEELASDDGTPSELARRLLQFMTQGEQYQRQDAPAIAKTFGYGTYLM